MSYFTFLFIFLGIPLLFLAGLTWRDKNRGKKLPDELDNWTPWLAILAHIGVALLYTTPWDNYLVATGVWWYDPNLVTGIVIGWVPIEEYTFFVLQPIFTGLWLLYLARRLPPLPLASPAENYGWRWLLAGLFFLLWLGSGAILLSGWQPAGTYLGLELIWALPPIIFQVGFGGDILWQHRRVVLTTLSSTTLYLCLADAVALGAGTWTIDPAQSLGIYLGGILPLEEFVFFLLTNTLITFGMILVLARQSQSRLSPAWQNWLARIVPLRNS